MKTCKAADAQELPQRGRYLTVVAGRAKSRASFCPRHASYRAWETRCFTGRPVDGESLTENDLNERPHCGERAAVPPRRRTIRLP
jgi:hypothetical protein